MAQQRAAVSDHFPQHSIHRPLPQQGIVVQLADKLAAESPHIVHVFLNRSGRFSRRGHRFNEWSEASNQPLSGRDVLVHSHPGSRPSVQPAAISLDTRQPPAGFLERDLERILTVDVLDDDQIALLAKNYGVSDQALLIRLWTMGYMVD